MSLIFLRLHPSASSLRNRICFDEGAVQLFSLVRFSLHCNIACCFSSIAAVQVSELKTKLGIYNPEKDLAETQSQIPQIYFRKRDKYFPKKSVFQWQFGNNSLLQSKQQYICVIWKYKDNFFEISNPLEENNISKLQYSTVYVEFGTEVKLISFGVMQKSAEPNKYIS